MKLKKAEEKHILEIYEKWLHAYMNADVPTYDSYLHKNYHFIGSTNNEEFLDKKHTTDFFKLTGEQFAGISDLRNETKIIEQFDELIFITHFFDAYFLNENDWSYYGRFRFSSVMKIENENHLFIYQHFSMPDSKSDDGQTIGFENVKTENIELKEAIKRRTRELEIKNRALEVENALTQIRAEAMAMTNSGDLLDIVVTMRNEFIKLGHDAHYFWHMMWLPDKYEKAMTSGDGTRIGFVMDLPRHIHSNIPLIAEWEKGTEATVVYAMNTEEAIDYVDKMVELGNFQNIDPQAPSHDDLRHISGLTFIMARTSHGEIGYSLPGVVKNPPQKDLDILVHFAGAFDLAHQRFLDLQKAEQQAREVEIELALEKLRSRTMAMQKSDELSEVSFLLDTLVRELDIVTWGCAFNIYGEKESTEWFGNEKGELNTYTVPRIGVFKDYYDKGQNGESLHIREFKGDECVEHYEFMSTLPGIGEILKQLKKTNKGFPTFQIDHVVYFKYGYLLFITREDVPEAHEIFKRFAKVFEQTYTRFLDLQRAEEQAREAQIEAALERVRARSMAMHSSTELKDVIRVIFDQMAQLKINAEHAGIVVDYQPKKDWHFWVADHQDIPSKITVPYLDLPWDKQFTDAKKNRQDFFTTKLNLEEKNRFYKQLLPHIENLTKEAEDFYLNCPGLAASTVIQEDIGLYIENFSGIPFTADENAILKRFAKVFQQTYIRFLDLQKAEDQAKEAVIETSLERVRTASMAMHKTEDLSDVVIVYFEQLKQLEIQFVQAWITIFHLDKGSVDVWFSPLEGLYDTPTHFNMPSALFEETSIKSWKEGNSFSSISFETKEQVNHFFEVCDEVTASNYFGDIQKKLKLERFELLDANHKYGCISKSNSVKATDEEKDILERFAKVFEQTYTRFLDLQKAEAQAREAQIEMALERVRSRTMAMQNSSELPEAANNLFLQVQDLGIPAWSAGYCIWEKEDKKSAWCNMSSEGEIQKGFSLPTVGEGYNFDKPLRNKETFHVSELDGKALVKHYDFMKTLPGIGEVLEEFDKKGIELPRFQIFHIVYFTHGYLMFITYEAVPNNWDVFKRFGKVFQQTYTRFLDLKRVEAQAREAQIEAALEKVRSRSLSMQQPNELNEVVQLIAEKLQELDVILDLGGVVICTYFLDSKDVLHWIATPDSESSGKFHLPYFDHIILREAWASKNKGDQWFSKAYSIEEKNSFFKHAFKHSDYKHFPEEAKKDILNRKHHTLSFAWSKHSALLIPSYSGLMPSENEKDILIRFAKVFEHAYIRFMDLQDKEVQSKALLQEKKRLEETLSDLKATQKQLIQSEKMASLGELTAGIAHEIQNPLNFVNNFSEVSKELLEEMQEELENGDLEEVKVIMKDIIQNLEKINHHGKRADGIVKGMLQHSRAGNDKKEAADINALTDEYLRLAYHGLRAKDKSFNAELITDFDNTIKPIRVVPQDIGRVILNLLTNAFYIVHQKKQTTKVDYKPTVSISTKHNNENIEISVKDNGNGIPEHIKGKIFQPFFTTKPTGQGTGLGLSMSYDIVKAHGGEITIDSSQGKGTTFFIHLPIKGQ